MWLLTVDTALKGCNVALSQNGVVKHAVALDEGITHSSRVLKSIEHVMAAANMRLSDLDGLGVTTGPGSFTGLRIGLSTVKGLALALDKPVAGLCVLEALAHQAQNSEGQKIMAVLDGGKKEVFVRVYEVKNNVLSPLSGYLNLSYGEAGAAIEPDTALTGNGVSLIEPHINANVRGSVAISPAVAWQIANQTLASMAHEAFITGKTLNGGAVVPNYIRKSDAEISRQ